MQFAMLNSNTVTITGSRPVTCLTYHHFAAKPCGATRQLGVTTDPATFEAQLDHAQRHYRVIGLDRLLAGDIPDRAALITIDDAYRSVLEVAAPALKTRGLPALMFANPGPIGMKIVPFDLLAAFATNKFGAAETARAASSDKFPARSFGELMNGYVARLGLADRHLAKARILHLLATTEADLHDQLDLFLNPAELRSLPGFGIEVANHTLSHIHCGPLDEQALRTEIVTSKDMLEDMLGGASGQAVRAFAFPWGRRADATEIALRVIRESGHKATFLMHGRRNVTRAALDIWYRMSVTDEPPALLWLTLEVWPRLREIRARLGRTDVA